MRCAKTLAVPAACTAVLAGAGFLSLPGCLARRSEPLVGPLEIRDESVAQGRQAFMRTCYQCHPEGAAGLGPGINDKPLPGGLIKFQVRHGLGAMPAFGPEKISDEELDGIVAYLKAMRGQGTS
jgi:mono/diheme cytochrome c family protein